MDICYKVVKPVDGSYRSLIQSSFSLVYEQTKITKAITGEIFVFKYLQDAIDYAEDEDVILRCWCGDMVPMGVVASVWTICSAKKFVDDNSHWIKDFWIDSAFADCVSAPEGTYGVSWICPISEMTVYRGAN